MSPVNYYGFTKLEVEKTFKLVLENYQYKLCFTALFQCAGYDLKVRIKVPDEQSSNLIPKIMRVLKGKQKELEIFGSDYKTKDGTCIRDYIHVNDRQLLVESLNYLNQMSNRFS